MQSKSVLFCAVFVFYTAFCELVHSATTHNVHPLEFITQEHASLSAMTYGFKLLEEIRQIRMGCEEKRDESEQKFTLELQNWMKYSQQTQQVIAQPEFERYSSESKDVVEETLTSTYRELYSSRVRKLNVIERQCDEKLEKLLQNRKMSMLLLVADLINNDPGRLRDFVTELREYKTQLHNGLQSCIERQALQYESRLSSKVLAPEDYCLGPDIEILTVFLNRMLDIIREEQENFFGDDEDLGIDTPCGISGCQEEEDGTHSGFASSTIQQPTTQTTHPPSSSTHTTLPHTHESTQPPHTGGTQDTTPQPPTSEPHTHDSTQPPHTDGTQDTTPQPPTSEQHTHESTQPSHTDGTQDTTPQPPTSEPHTHESTQPPHTDGTQIATTTDIKPQPPTSEFSTEPGTVPESKPTLTTHQTTAYDSTQPTTITYTPFTETDVTPETKPHVTETDPTREQTSTYSETEPPTITAPTDESSPSAVPEWVNDAVNDILHGKAQMQPQEQEDDHGEEGLHRHHHSHGEDTKEDSSHSARDGDSRTGSRHNGHGGSHNSHSAHDGDSRTESRHGGHGGFPNSHSAHDGDSRTGSHHSESHNVIIDIPQDGGHSDSDGNIQNDSNSSHIIYQKLIYSFSAVLVAAILVLVAAIIIVRLKRRQLIKAHLLPEEQKIAVMKQIGYVNPTYKFFDKQNDG